MGDGTGRCHDSGRRARLIPKSWDSHVWVLSWHKDSKKLRGEVLFPLFYVMSIKRDIWIMAVHKNPK